MSYLYTMKQIQKTKAMKAIISQLWDTGIDIITTESDSNEIQSFTDLKKCENILVEKQEKGVPFREILLNDMMLSVSFRTVTHPTGMGKLRICEIF